MEGPAEEDRNRSFAGIAWDEKRRMRRWENEVREERGGLRDIAKRCGSL